MYKIIIIAILLQVNQVFCELSRIQEDSKHSNTEFRSPVENNYFLGEQNIPDVLLEQNLLQNVDVEDLFPKNKRGISPRQQLIYKFRRNGFRDRGKPRFLYQNNQHYESAYGLTPSQNAEDVRRHLKFKKHPHSHEFYLNKNLKSPPSNRHINRIRNIQPNRNLSSDMLDDTSNKRNENLDFKAILPKRNIATKINSLEYKTLSHPFSENISLSKRRPDSDVKQDLNESMLLSGSTNHPMINQLSSTDKLEEQPVYTQMLPNQDIKENSTASKISDIIFQFSKPQSNPNDIQEKNIHQKPYKRYRTKSLKAARRNDIAISIFGDFEHYTNIPREKKELSDSVKDKAISQPEKMRTVSLVLMGLALVIIFAVVTICLSAMFSKRKAKAHCSDISIQDSNYKSKKPGFIARFFPWCRKKHDSEQNRMDEFFSAESSASSHRNMQLDTLSDRNHSVSDVPFERRELRTIPKERFVKKMSYSEITDSDDSRREIQYSGEMRGKRWMKTSSSNETVCTTESITLKKAAYVTRRCSEINPPIHQRGSGEVETVEHADSLLDFSNPSPESSRKESSEIDSEVDRNSELPPAITPSMEAILKGLQSSLPEVFSDSSLSEQ